MPRRTGASSPLRMSRNAAGSSESIETFTRFSPAARRGSARFASIDPFVVIETSGIWRTERSMICSMSNRMSGSPSVKFTGGEPLIRLDMEQIIDRSVRQIPDVSMTTNGSMLAKRAEGLRAAGLKRVNVAIDSLDPAAFRDIRKGELAPVLRGIQEALRVGLKPVKLNMVVFKQTLPHIPRMIDFISNGDGLKL